MCVSREFILNLSSSCIHLTTTSCWSQHHLNNCYFLKEFSQSCLGFKLTTLAVCDVGVWRVGQTNITLSGRVGGEGGVRILLDGRLVQLISKLRFLYCITFSFVGYNQQEAPPPPPTHWKIRQIASYLYRCRDIISLNISPRYSKAIISEYCL